MPVIKVRLYSQAEEEAAGDVALWESLTRAGHQP